MAQGSLAPDFSSAFKIKDRQKLIMKSTYLASLALINENTGKMWNREGRLIIIKKESKWNISVCIVTAYISM